MTSRQADKAYETVGYNPGRELIELLVTSPEQRSGTYHKSSPKADILMKNEADHAQPKQSRLPRADSS